MQNTIISINQKRKIYRCLLSLTIFLFAIPGLSGQVYPTINGKLTDQTTGESIAYANVGLYSASDLKFINGIISDSSGYFAFSNVAPGKYILKISMIGYEQISRDIDITNNNRYEAGTLLMTPNSVNLGETIVVAERLKGRAEKDRTAYYITKKMVESSNNGLDIVKLIPGVQVDLMRNISIDGSQNTLILVDGKEREKNFLSQINPGHIDRVEILSAPPSGYDGNITGVINIVLKKEKNQGISGQFNLEIPSSPSLFYVHPDYNFTFASKKLNIYTSYNGELIHFDQHESILRQNRIDGEIFETKSDQCVKQKLWSHRFHYGLDYSFSPRTLMSFYAYYNPYSQEYDGVANAVSDLNNNGPWRALRNTSDINRSTFYSLYLKHSFNEKGGELILDVSSYRLLGENVATYTRDSDGSFDIKNTSKPFQNALNIKADFNLPLKHNITVSTGARMRTYTMSDRTATDFRYSGELFSAYATLSHTLSNFDWSLGLRVEKSISELGQVFDKHFLNVLPSAAFGYKISSDQTLKFSMSNTVNRPNIYYLNPNLSMDDPYTIRRGNPSLDPELRTALSLEYSRKFKSNFGAVRLFYDRTGNSINYVTFLNDTSAFETQIYNLGVIHQSGFQFSGTFKAAHIITFIPYLRLYAQFTDGNDLAEEYSIKNRSQIVVDPGFSSIVAFKHDINLSLSFQYGSPRNSIAGNSFSDPLYFISLDKTFKKRIKVGIVSALLFKRAFTYQGSALKSQDFYARYEGIIKLSRPLFHFKLSYQFNAGRKHDNINHTREDSDAVPKKGF